MAEARLQGHSRGYQAAHMHVRKIKGRAAEQPCATTGCDRSAYDWAYTGTGEFSRDPDNYIALCRPCHRVLDGGCGEQHRFAKLTEQAVRDIRERYAAGASQRAIAQQYGVAQTTVGHIVRRSTWKHVTI